jgi:DNA gyrase subunit A
MGKKGMSTRDEDFVTSLFIANTHDTLLVFTTRGKVYPLQVYEIPEAGRAAKGRPIVNMVPVDKDEKIAAVVSVREFDTDEMSLMFVSRQGIIKRTVMQAFKNLRTGGMIACGVAEEDELMIVRFVPHDVPVDVMIFSRGGRCIRFPWNDVPVYGRTARGNRGMRLRKGDEVVDALTIPAMNAEPPEEDVPESEEEEVEDNKEELVLEQDERTLMTITEFGYGKRTRFGKYRVQRRNGLGLLSFKTDKATGNVIGAVKVCDEDQLMLVTDTGRVIRIGSSSVRVLSRVTKGVRLMRLDDKERIVDMARILEEEEDEASEE